MKKKEWYLSVHCNNTKLNMKVDTGASCNVMPLHVYNSLIEKPALRKHSARLSSYSGHNLPVVGETTLLVERSRNFSVLDFVVPASGNVC